MLRMALLALRDRVLLLGTNPAMLVENWIE